MTQVVWKSSTRLGCGIVGKSGGCGPSGANVVCRYSPTGNMNMGSASARANVPPPNGGLDLMII